MGRTGRRLLVIGGGTAGLAAARTARAAGARVTMVADGPLGGECTWTGCVPSKALLEGAAAGQSYEQALAHLVAVRDGIARTEDESALREEGIEVIRGRARLTSATRVAVAPGAREVVADRVVLATGSTPQPADVPGLSGVDPLTTDDVFDLEHLPVSLIILGGGTVGCELAQAYARFGVEVTLFEPAERLLPQEEPEASRLIATALLGDGVFVVTGERATRASADATGVRIDLADGSHLRAARVLSATGRRAAGAGLGLEALGARVDHGRIAVNPWLRTSVPGVYGAGDVTGLAPLTHAADAMGRQAANNALGTMLRGRFSTRATPWVTFTDPEVARVGLTTAQVGRGARVAHLPMAEVDRALVAGRTDGFVTLISGPRRVGGFVGGGRLLGATVVGPRAGEIINELALVMHLDALTGRLAQVQHAYPSWSVALAQAAGQFFVPMNGRTARRV